MRARRPVTLIGALLGAALLVPVPPASAAAPTATAAAPATAAASCGVVFTAEFAAALAKKYPGRRVTAAVYDTRTRCWYHLHPSLRLTTASVIKAGVLGATLLRAQDRGRGPTAWERARIKPMITYSYNNPSVSDLLGRVGGVAGMHRFDVRMGATHTTESLAYGATVTTAKDRTLVTRGLLYGGGPLRAAGRAIALDYLSAVTPTQRWGITRGVPAGWHVALKNGFYPMRGNGWRVGSTGFVRRAGTTSGYVITVLSDRNPSQVAGMSLVETVALRVAQQLAGPKAAPRVVSRSVCATARSGWSWRTAATKVHVASSRWAEVRRVSGGNPSPLSGQRVCSPDLGPVPG
ncbi:serine hydrolase [Angustibacter luteus]|uniref:Serine hydrolase n=1 Tax=Angustibacter luteus TaxID=658456 RepID=A0ABW1J8R8_9ACTN